MVFEDVILKISVNQMSDACFAFFGYRVRPVFQLGKLLAQHWSSHGISAHFVAGLLSQLGEVGV